MSKNVKLIVNEDEVSWKIDHELTSVSIGDIDQALYSLDQNAIVVLAGAAQSAKRIVVFELDGSRRCDIPQPEETYFHQLGPNREHDVAVFSTVYSQGWRDWWLSIDTRAAIVERLGEGR